MSKAGNNAVRLKKDSEPNFSVKVCLGYYLFPASEVPFVVLLSDSIVATRSHTAGSLIATQLWCRLLHTEKYIFKGVIV